MKKCAMCNDKLKSGVVVHQECVESLKAGVLGQFFSAGEIAAGLKTFLMSNGEVLFMTKKGETSVLLGPWSQALM